MRKKVIVALIAFIIGFTAGKYIIDKNNKKVAIKEVITTSTDNFFISDGEKGIILSDGSWASINESKNIYEFQPVDLGDWNYTFNNKKELENCINTYIELKNN